MKPLVSVIAGLILLPSVVLAQSISVEALHPQFKFADAEPSVLTTAWFVTVSLPIFKQVKFVGQLPFAFGKLEDSRVPTKDETIGNPAVGLRFEHEHLTIDVMARAPIVKNGFAGFIGSLADIDRQEAFIPDILPLFGMIKTKIDVGKLSLHPYGGATFTLKTEHERNEFFARVFRRRENDGELFALYGAEGWLQIQKLHLGAAYNARTWVSSGLSFGAGSINQLSFRAKLAFDNFEPEALFRLPLDDILLDYVVGLNFKVKL